MKVLVTGGAGFIGSHLVVLLVREGINVRVFDSLASGKQERLPEGIPFVKGDVRDRNAVLSAMQGVTHVVHLAALISVAESMTNPLSFHEVNVTGFENVLDAMRAAGVTRVVYASSAAVYGDDPVLPKSESSPLRPLSPYALSKAVNELQAGLYERAYGLSSVGLRPFNTYGPGQAGNHPYASVIPRWIEAMRAGHPITIYGDGSQTRDFIHVRDIAGAILRALTAEASGIFNIASGKETSLLALRDMLAKENGGACETRNEPARNGDISRSVADISVARRILGFEPSVPLEEGIRELFNL
ncbi:MAG: NAD-dependent epimerase/dehydratase family protein [Candidatus Liptonbacteria bacterium]|nr:NAD-dependent epimerase/dehydratase family protein [Candidatus Liptonbacteria bacterium]